MNQTDHNQADLLSPPSTNLQSSARGGRIAFVQSCWHKDIVDQCRSAFVSELGRLRGTATAIDFYEVPGAFEIPLQAKLLAQSGRYAAIVDAGFVVDGGIYRSRRPQPNTAYTTVPFGPCRVTPGSSPGLPRKSG